MTLALPLVPPSVGSAVIAPFRQRTGRQTSESPQKFSTSETEVSEKPTTSSLSFIENARLYGNVSVGASVLRSVISPLRHKKACSAVSPFNVEKPTTSPLLLIPN